MRSDVIVIASIGSQDPAQMLRPPFQEAIMAYSHVLLGASENLAVRTA